MGNKESSEEVEGSKKDEDTQTKGQKPHKNRGLDTLSGSLKDAFLREEDSDITINVGDQKYSAHKFILRHRSSVFKTMLEKNQDCVNISGCEPSIFRNFLLYLYTGKLENLSKENVFQLYVLSDKYDVKDLKIDCVDFILSNLNTSNVCDVLSLATKYMEHDMLTHATKFFKEKAKDILPTLNWQKFLTENPVKANELIIEAFNNDSNK